MGQYRRIPTVVEAVQWSGSNWHEVYALAGHEVYTVTAPSAVTVLRVRTGDGEEGACQPGDWLIRGVKGEFYPCRADVFAETYEEVVPE